VGLAVQALGAFLLIVAVLVTVARRFASHPVVTGSSILAAICIYLFIGLAFATVYGFIAAADAAALFANGMGDGTSAERIYYSYITLTTTGYGDFVPATDPARMTAITEALFGQVYLVTIVALLVSNIGSPRRRDRDRPAAGGA
jgi:voltage-gated potassium channel Kch